MPTPKRLARRPLAVGLLALSLFLPTHALGQTDAGPAAAGRLSRAQLLADADILERAFRALHPGLYRYNTAAELKTHLATLASPRTSRWPPPSWTLPRAGTWRWLPPTPCCGAPPNR